MASDLLDLIDPIVGMWHVKFVVVVKQQYRTQRHRIRCRILRLARRRYQEIMNSGGRPPQSGDFCLGVWAGR